jgi:hypothetical protein
MIPDEREPGTACPQGTVPAAGTVPLRPAGDDLAGGREVDRAGVERSRAPEAFVGRQRPLLELERERGRAVAGVVRRRSARHVVGGIHQIEEHLVGAAHVLDVEQAGMVADPLPLELRERHDLPARGVGRVPAAGQRNDPHRLEAAGGPVDAEPDLAESTPAGLPLATALGVALRGVELTWIVRDDLLEITTSERAQDQERLFVHVHNVADLADTGDGLRLLIDLVQSAVAPTAWDTVGGPGSIRPDSTALVISQSLEVQRQVAEFLGVLRRLKAAPADARRPLAVGGYWSDMPAAVAARAALAKPVTADFHETPLREVTAGLSKEAGVPIAVDTRELENAGLDLDLPVTFALTGKPLAVVLDRILEPLELVVDVQDEGLVVTTQEKLQATMTVAVYPVGQLGGGDRSVGSLAELIMSTLEPDSWDVVGGPAAVRPVDGDVPCLVVLQTTAGHRGVHGLLESLPPSRQPGAFAPTLEAEPRSGGMGGGHPFCWVAREVYGVDDPRWLVFHDWLTADAPTWLHDLYGKHGEAFAAWIRDKPAVKRVLRVLMDHVVVK